MPAVAQQPRTIVPLPGETQPAFAIRFHEGMADVIPETDQRDREMMQAWTEDRGPSKLDRKAQQRFSRDHVRRRDIPIFKEHVIEGDEDSDRHVYNRDAMVAIVNRCNYRIADTGDFVPICEGHTPTEPDIPQPDVLGYAGPFRLGMVGNEEPKWAIFGDEWHEKSAVQKLQKLRRRSPEVWISHQGKPLPMAKRFFDPIAALGSETPFNDLGMAQYQRSTTAAGDEVVRYSAVVLGS